MNGNRKKEKKKEEHFLDGYIESLAVMKNLKPVNQSEEKKNTKIRNQR